MAIIGLDDILEDVHYVYNSLKEVVGQVTKKLQLQVDSEADDPDADNSDFPVTIPRQFYATCYTFFQSYEATTDYNSYYYGYQPALFCYQLVLNNGVLNYSGLTCLGMCQSSGGGTPEMWNYLDATQKADCLSKISGAFSGNSATITTDYPDESVVFTGSTNNTFKTVNHNNSVHWNYTTLQGDQQSSAINVYMITATITKDDSTGIISPTYNSYSKLRYGGGVYLAGQPFEAVMQNINDARAWVGANGATHNYEQSYLVYGGSMTVLYGDNYIIYVIPQNVKLTYNLMYNVTKTITEKINSDNPSMTPIVVPTYNENKYGPTPPEPTDDDDDIDEQDMGVGTNLSGLGGYWLLTKAQLEDLHDALNSAPVGFDPLNSFISLMGLGVDVTKVLDATQIQYITPINIRMSDGTTWQTGVEAHIISDNEIVSAFNSDVFRIQRKYNNFLDYSPYATHELFIPMCGWVTLPDIAVDRDIYVTYIPDIESCKCRAVVSVVSNSEDDDGNGCVIAEKDGIMGSDVPFSNVGHSLFVGDAIINGANVAGEAITMAIGAGFTKTGASGKTFRPYEGFTLGGSGTLPSAIGNALVSGNINRTHFMTGNSTKTGFSDGESIIVKSVYHIPDMPDNYAHTVGLVCNKTGQLTEFNGFTVCDNPHITFSALEAEKEEIKRLLEEGVILPSGE